MRYSVLICTGSLFYLTNIDFHVLRLCLSQYRSPLTRSPTCAVAQRWEVANSSCLVKKWTYFPHCCNIWVTKRAPKIHVCSTHKSKFHYIIYKRYARILKKSRSHLKILGVRRETWSKSHNEEPQSAGRHRTKLIRCGALTPGIFMSVPTYYERWNRSNGPNKNLYSTLSTFYSEDGRNMALRKIRTYPRTRTVQNCLTRPQQEFSPQLKTSNANHTKGTRSSKIYGFLCR